MATDATQREMVAVPAQTKPITGRWWFWTALGAAVVGAIVTLFLVDRKPDRPACPTTDGYVCPP